MVMNAAKKIHLEKESRPTLMQLRRSLGTITSRQVAELAGVPLHEEYLMEIGRPVTRQLAETILHALSLLAGQHYTLEDIDVSFKDVDSSAGYTSPASERIN